MSYFDEDEDFEIIDQIMENGEEFNPLQRVYNSTEYEDEMLQELLTEFKKKKQKEKTNV